MQNSNKIIDISKGRKKKHLSSNSSSLNKAESVDIKKLKEENLRLRAEIDYLKKLEVLMDIESQRHNKK